MLPKGYVVLNVSGGDAYVRKDRLNELRRADGVVFDCDGVLVDVRNSYNRAISKAVVYLLGGLTGCAVPEGLISDGVIFLFRRSGGFNCDRDTVYGILMFMLSKMPREPRNKLRKLVERAVMQPDLLKRFSLVREAVKNELKPDGLDVGFFEGLVDELKGFTGVLDETGPASVDKNLLEGSGASESFVAFYNAMKQFLYQPAEVGKSIVATIFEEFFCGPELVQKTYGVEPRFYAGSGMVENETVIIQAETLDRLTSVLGKANIGVASGSMFEPRRHVLGGLLEKFNPEALVFLDVVEEAERERSKRECSAVNLKKPHPFSLIKAAEAFGSFNCALYVGDSMEDALMAREARKLDERFLFVGVYRYSGVEDIVLRGFLEAGCDTVIPSVNELPYVLEAVRRKKS
ncbi:MAG: hypothetical protein NWF14_01625 [Candidatus Bathyarchaeota archaeon]|nr:hypothetical protein [Candidatus Bathyarchaeota archaeon]